MSRSIVAGTVLVCALAGALPGAYARSGSDPGITPTSILLGGTVALTGEEAAPALARGAEAYFAYVNEQGGVRGRRVQYRYLDDGSKPTETVRRTRELVEDEKVFAVFNSVGTEQALAVRPYLNQVEVPQLFVRSGVSALALERRQYPWTIGYQPRFAGEGALYGRYSAKTRPRARLAVLHEQSAYGEDMFVGLRRGLGRLSTRIVADQAYVVADPDVSAQIARLKASRADTLMLFAMPRQTAQALLAADRLGWRPRIFISSQSIDPSVIDLVRQGGAIKVLQGAISSAALKDPTDPALARDRGVQLYKRILSRFVPGARVKDVNHLYGMAAAYTMVDALRAAGREPTRASLLRAATHLNERANPFFVKGIAIRTAPGDYFPVERTRLLRFTKGRWRPFGGLAVVR